MSILYGPLGGHATLAARFADTAVFASGYFNTIIGNGKDQEIHAGLGNASVTTGAPGDGRFGIASTIRLGGSNTVVTGDENATITSWAGGNTVTVGEGVNNISLAGPGNTVNVNQFAYISVVPAPLTTLSPGSGGAIVNYAGGSPGGRLNVKLAGTGNVVSGDGGVVDVSGGAGSNQVSLVQSVSTIHLSGQNNFIQLRGSQSSSVFSGSDGAGVIIDGVSPGGGQSSSNSIVVGGGHNLLQLDGGRFFVSGGSGSQFISIKDSDGFTVDTPGPFNFISTSAHTGAIGEITSTGGFANITDASASGATIAIGGLGNQVTGTSGGDYHVTGGVGQGRFQLQASSVELTTSGQQNAIYCTAITSDIAAGGGSDTIFLQAATARLTLKGAHNFVVATVGDLTSSGGEGFNTFVVSQSGPAVANIVTGGMGNLIHLSQFSGQVSTGSGYATVTVGAPGDGSCLVPGHVGTVLFGGAYNAITAGDESLIVKGGSGNSDVQLGDGDDTVQVGGSSNHVTLGAGHDVVDLAGGQNTIAFHGTDLDATIAGIANTIELDAGSQGMLLDNSTGLLLKILPGVGDVDITGFGAGRQGVIDLVGGAGGYATVSDVLTALHSDGAGGSILDVGGGHLHLIGVSSLQQSNILIG